MATIVRELEALERLHSEYGFIYAQLAQALNTSEPTLHRWRRGTGGEPTPVYLKRLEAFEAFLEELDELFASKRAAAAWIDKSLSVLKNRTPREMIIDGHVDRVTGVLYALNAGVSLQHLGLRRDVGMPLTQTPLVGLAFRATSPRYSDLHKTAAMSCVHPRRFNTPGVGAVYVSREPETAIEEFRRRAARDGVSLADMHPRSIFVLDLLLHHVVDLTAPGQLEAWGLTAGDLASDDMERCQEVAGIAARLGAEAIRWASATGAGQSVAVFVGQLQPGSHVEMLESFDLTREMLSTIATGASLATLIPALGDLPLLE